MTDEASTSTHPDRWGLGFGKHNSERRAALVDHETGEQHQYRLTDAVIGRRNAEVAVELLRIYSHQGRVFISPDTAALYALTLNAITMSTDAIALFDGIREGKLTAREIRDLINGLDAAAKRQRDDAIARAEAEAQADADAYPGRSSASAGAAAGPHKQ